MYRPTPYREDNIDKLVAFMQANSFAVLVSIQDNIPVASHIPLVVTAENGQVGLTGHLAKANPQWQLFDQGESLAIFTGPHAYISPALYEKHESVPTWNYIAVHAYGTPQPITLSDSHDQMNEMIEQMISTYEAGYHSHWNGLSDQYREGMMNGIVGFRMNVTRLEGKYKLSQNRSQIDQKNVADSLLQSPDPTISAVGTAMQQNLENQS
jgi:transcriptional regulator